MAGEFEPERRDRLSGRQALDRARRRRPGAYAAIDLGTHNCRMLVAVPTGDGFRVIDSFSRIVRLGEDVSDSGVLSGAAITRTIAALKICADKMRRHRVVASRNVATAACRCADNCHRFVDRVREETGLTLEIISPQEEARLTLAGCAPLLDPRIPEALVFDIGGGSTELTHVTFDEQRRPVARDVMSLCCGAVTLAERYGGDVVPPATYATMVEEMASCLRPFEERNRLRERIAQGRVQMLGTSGTVTTLGAILLGLPRYMRSRVDGLEMEFEAMGKVSQRLSAMDFEARAANLCIGPERADLVVAGCAILEAICGLWSVGRLRVADRGIREGLLLELMAEDRRGGPAPMATLDQGVDGT